MGKEVIYWTMANGKNIDIDEMSEYYLRNALKYAVKHLIKKSDNIQKYCPHNINDAIAFSDAEIEALTNKSQYQLDNEENMWK